MIIQVDREIEQATTVDELRPILRLLVKALNTVSDAKTQFRGDLILRDGGLVMRGSDGQYYRLGWTVTAPETITAKYTLVGKNPTGE